MSAAPSDAALGALDAARRWAQAGDPRATAGFRRVLELSPGCVEAHVFLARAAMAAGQPQAAVAQLEQACAIAPADAALQRSLGVAAHAAHRPDLARAALERAVALAPHMHAAHLHLGKVLEALGDRAAATRAYFRAITRAQFAGQWLNETGIPAHLRAEVLHAMAFVRTGRVAVLGALLEPLHARFGRDEMRRVERCLHGYLGLADVAPEDPRQRPKFLHFPGVPSTPYLDTAGFDWIEGLEAAFPAIRDEARAVLADPAAAQPFLAFGAGDEIDAYLQGTESPPRWDAFFFHRHGEAFPAGHARCPATSAALSALPLPRIAGHAPEVCFSLLSPGTHILPHHGVTNVRAVVHLPLVVPAGCALRVGGIEHAWQPGRCVAFDDTWLHEAWNRGDATRAILLLDAWNPHLTVPEREAMVAVIEGIGEFHRG